MNSVIIAIDPGREKCGIAVVHQKQGVMLQKVIATAELTIVVQELMAQYSVQHIVMGDGTSSRGAKHSVEQIKSEGQSIEVSLIDEHHSTDEARCLYWKRNPPQGIKRFIPVTMQVPPQPVDDYVAVILAQRYFAQKTVF